MDQVAIGAAIVAVTEAIKRAVPQVSGVYTIILAGVLGLLAGLAGMAGLDWASGIVIGLSAAGAVKVGTTIGVK